MSESNSTSDKSGSIARRVLKFQSLDEIMADAEQVALGSSRALGQWSPGQIFIHLARGLDLTIDGSSPAPWYVRFVGRTFLKKRFLVQTMQSGWKVPAKSLVPGETETIAGLNALRSAIQRMKSTTVRQPHPIFGILTPDEWIAFHCRHAELHLSFLVPQNGSSPPETAGG